MNGKKFGNYGPALDAFMSQIEESRIVTDTTDQFGVEGMVFRSKKLEKADSALYSENMNAPTREELNAKLESVEAKMDGKIAAIQSSLELKLTELRGEVAHSTEVLRSEMHKGNTELIKWIVGAALTSMAVFVTVMTFVLNNAVPKQEKAVQQPAPIVIQVPSNIPPPAVPAQK